MPPHPTRRSADTIASRWINAWLPALVVAGGGLIAWGAFSQKLDDTIRRVAGSEVVIIGLQDRNQDLVQRLSRIEAKVDGLPELLRSGVFGDFRRGLVGPQ